MHKSLFVVMLLVLLAVLCACQTGKPAHPAGKPVPTVAPLPTGTPDDLVSDEGQLIAKAESQEEAQAIAELYGITLVEFKRNLALFYTEEDPRAVIQRGQENGWPELTLNHVAKPS